MHYCFHVGKITIDDARHSDDVRDALNGLAKDVVGNAKGVEEARSTLDSFHQTLVGNDDDSVNSADELLEGLLGLHHSALAFEGERLGDDGHAQGAQFAGE